jgi:imidazolonepropionase-like amidohydrolase
MSDSIRQSKVRSIFILLWPLICVSSVAGQTEPVIGLHVNTPKIFALTHARIVTRPGDALQEATLLVRDGYIEQVGAEVDIPPDAVVRDMGGKTIYPGFIDLYTEHGIGPGASDSESGGAKHWNPYVLAQRRASAMLSQDQAAAEDFRKAGFCAVLTFPKDGIFKGAGALVLLGQNRPNQTILAEDVAAAISLRNRGSRQYPVSLMGVIALIRQTLLDTQWYEQAWAKFMQASAGQTAPETNLALAALSPYVRGDKPVVMQVSDEIDVLRASKIAQEFGLNMWALGSGYEYRRLEAVKETHLRLIVPVNFPKAPDVSSLEQELRLSLRELRHWDFAAENPARLAESGVEFVLTTAYLKSRAEFLGKARLAVQRGLSDETALEALTMRPAEWLGMSRILGTLEKGKLANLVVTDGDLFNNKTLILETWVAGERFVVTSEPDVDIRGQWTFVAELQDKRIEAKMKCSGAGPKLSVTLHFQDKETKAQKVTRQDRLLMLSFPGEMFGCGGWVRLTGIIEGKTIRGHGVLDDASSFNWRAEIAEPQKDPAESKEPPGPAQMAQYPIVYPEGAFGRAGPPEQPAVLLVKDATIWTCGPNGILSPGDLLVRGGKIAQVGRNLAEPDGAVVVNAAGKHVTPGLIDAHSHLAISGGVNESTHAVTSEVRIEDVIDSDDINIYRQLAGGLTTACTLHGSANPIGGTYAVIKLRWGALPNELLIEDARPGLKLALGENVKRSSERYPDTRMGTVEIIRDAFLAAKDYRTQWQICRQQSQKNRNLIPPRTDLRHERLLDILDGKMIIHCHAYRQDEIHAMIYLADEIGFKFDVFVHVLEGYKAAEEMKRHGAMATTFSDWWAYKMEAYDAIPYNGAILHEQGVVVSFNSDSVELARRMNTEAAKAVKYGGVPHEEALRFVTLNAARQLCLDQRIGSLETGKDADFVVWSQSPLSAYSVCEQTWIEGRKYFDIAEDQQLREQVAAQRTKLVQKILDEGKKARKDQEDASEKPADPNEVPDVSQASRPSEGQ